MIVKEYKNQVELIISVLPELNKEKRLALHGGTAINLFVRNMPRLSVDIDLTYLPIEDRERSLNNILQILQQLDDRIHEKFKRVTTTFLKNDYKLIIDDNGTAIKVEINTIKRGCYKEPYEALLCEKATHEFGMSCEMQIVETGHLYGGKICAALDRQHPRDIFDIKLMLDREGFSDEIKHGFIFYLISSNRPIHEMLFPKFIDQKSAFENQFQVMTEYEFSYNDFKETRNNLIKLIHSRLLEKDKEFLLSILQGAPNWGEYDFRNFPAVQWKLLNIERLKRQNSNKHEELIETLKEKLYKI